MTTALAYPDLKAPAEDGNVLIWPQPQQLLDETLKTHQRLAGDQTRIQNVPLAQIRAAARRFIGHDDSPLLASGHQTELYHPGVWAKDALTNAAAARIGGQAYHFAVDSDAPKRLSIRWPVGAAPITDDPRLTSAAWSGQLDPPSPAHLQALGNLMEQAALQWSFSPVLPHVFDSLRRLALEVNTLSSALTNAQHALDWELGLRHHALTTSPIWISEPFALFAYHILANAEQFARDYNDALQSYREAHGMKTRSRPVPDLAVSEEVIEVPFWLDDLATGKRLRAHLKRDDGGWSLELGNGQRIRFNLSVDGWQGATELSRWLVTNSHRMAPRALILTMFMRLCVVDQFVHGIGGGRYDQVTNALISRHFGIEPPGFSVTTATLYFPHAVGQTRVCVPCVVHEGHQLRHALLGKRKTAFVERISALPRRSAQREAVFQKMHDALEAASVENPKLRQWQQKFSQFKQREREEVALFDRELFYALQPRERLTKLIDQYQSAFAGTP